MTVLVMEVSSENCLNFRSSPPQFDPMESSSDYLELSWSYWLIQTRNPLPLLAMKMKLEKYLPSKQTNERSPVHRSMCYSSHVCLRESLLHSTTAVLLCKCLECLFHETHIIPKKIIMKRSWDQIQGKDFVCCWRLYSLLSELTHWYIKVN